MSEVRRDSSVGRVLVTGGNGFIGKFVCKRLKELGYFPLVFDLPGDDVTDRALVGRMFNFYRLDGVVHLGQVLGTHELFDDFDEAVDVNIKGTWYVANACLKHDIPIVMVDQPHIWVNPYEMTKGAAIRILEILHESAGLRYSVVESHNAFGPGQAHGEGHPQKIIPTFATAAWRGEVIPVWGEGEQKVSLCWVGDVADAVVDAVTRLIRDPLALPRRDVVGATEPMTVMEVALIVRDAVTDAKGTGEWSLIDRLPMRRGEQYGEIPTGHTPLKWGMLYETIMSYRPEDVTP